MAVSLCLLVSVGGRCSQRSGPLPTVGTLGPSYQRRDKSHVSLQGPPCAHGLSGIPHGEVPDKIRGPPWCYKCMRNLAILAYSWHIGCSVTNIDRLIYIGKWLLMSEGVKFVTGSGPTSPPCHLNCSPYLSWDWVIVGCWTLQDHWLSHHVE